MCQQKVSEREINLKMTSPYHQVFSKMDSGRKDHMKGAGVVDSRQQWVSLLGRPEAGQTGSLANSATPFFVLIFLSGTS